MGILGKQGWLRSGLVALVTAATFAASASGAAAQWLDDDRGTFSYGYYNWMHKDVKGAWAKGYEGQKTRVIVVDDFTHTDLITNRLDDFWIASTHGYITRRQIDMLAPRSDVRAHHWDFTNDKVSLHKKNLNVINLSIGWSRGANPDWDWNPMIKSVIKAAKDNKAVIAKAAGNQYGLPVGDRTFIGDKWDSLALDMVGSKSVLFVGALSKHGHKKAKASMATYSSIAGSKKSIQKRFLVIGVDNAVHGITGTSFAAPIAAGYAAILGSKFKKANAKEISLHMLKTTTRNTILNYDKAVHGMGEACLACALAPKKIK